MNKTYKHIFLDWDRTIYDFDQNSLETLRNLYDNHGLSNRKGLSFDAFIGIYHLINRHMWGLYMNNQITKDYLLVERFYRTLSHFGLGDYAVAEQMNQEYLDILPSHSALMLYAEELLEYLSEKYKLYIITNGFTAVQAAKIKACGLDHYFTHVITSEIANSKKPQPEIFEYALKLAGASVDESIMIGDDQVSDIKGAKSFGMDQIFYNPKNRSTKIKSTHKVTSLREIMDIL